MILTEPGIDGTRGGVLFGLKVTLKINKISKHFETIFLEMGL